MKIYDIFLSTPLGKKSGELEARIKNGRLSGYLSLLGHTEPIDGTVDKDGNCRIKGKFVTLMNTISFTANGIIGNALKLTLNAVESKKYYEMLGVLRGQKGRDKQ